MKVTRLPKNPPMKRLAYWVPKELTEKVWAARESHLPKPRKTYFVQFLLEMALDEYERLGGFNGRLFKMFLGRKRFRVDLYMERAVVGRFKRVADGHVPRTTRTNFLIFLLQWGLLLYEKEYTIYGFKKRYDLSR